MAYETLDDVRTVTLGGTNEKTGKKNPLKVEGYFERVEQRPNKFNKDKPQNYYIFSTSEGEFGLYGKAGLDREMRKATIGVLTEITNTEQTLDVGKGNPMIVFKVRQDRSKTIVPRELSGGPEDDGVYESAEVFNEDLADNQEDEGIVEAPVARPSAPTRAATLPSTSQQAKIQELLKRNQRPSV